MFGLFSLETKKKTFAIKVKQKKIKRFMKHEQFNHV